MELPRINWFSRPSSCHTWPGRNWLAVSPAAKPTSGRRGRLTWPLLPGRNRWASRARHPMHGNSGWSRMTTELSRISCVCLWITTAKSLSYPLPLPRKMFWRFARTAFSSRTGRATGAGNLRARKYPQACRACADIWHLPWTPVVWHCARRKNVQAEIRASRLESSGEKSAHQPSGNHRAESRLLRGPGIAAFERRGSHAPEFERPHQRRHAPQESAAVQRAVSPGSFAGPARFALPVLPVHRHDEGICTTGELPMTRMYGFRVISKAYETIRSRRQLVIPNPRLLRVRDLLFGLRHGETLSSLYSGEPLSSPIYGRDRQPTLPSDATSGRRSPRLYKPIQNSPAG